MAMEYRTLGRTGLDVGIIGLGTEHMARTQESMEQVLHTAVDAGLNYVDLVYADPKGADAEFWTNFGPVLRRYRDRLVVAAHWGSGVDQGVECCQRYFDDVLAETGNGYAEIAILTMVDSEEKWNGWAQESLALLRQYRERGQIGAIGLSGHETPIAHKAVNSGQIDVLMFPVNLLAHGEEGDSALHAACAAQRVGLVAMKVYFGGTLLFVDGKPTPITPAQCLAYVLSLPVTTTVPGVKTAEELRQTLHYGEATDEEKDYRPALANVHQVLEGHCVYCRHCLPCPVEIPIDWVILLTDWAQSGVTDELRSGYAGVPAKASACIECGDCMARCPFKVDVIAKMQSAERLFEAGTA
jgi:predicted aldo/keto reductase-like oxidoreductase